MRAFILIIVLFFICGFLFSESILCGKIKDIILITFSKNNDCYVILKIDAGGEVITICGELSLYDGKIIQTGKIVCVEQTMFGKVIIVK